MRDLLASEEHVLFARSAAAGRWSPAGRRACWTIGGFGLEERSGREEIVVPMASMESSAIVDAMNQALAELATRLAATL
jgi:hypothetical protein